MAACAATSAFSLTPRRGGAKSSSCFLGQTIRPVTQLVGRFSCGAPPKSLHLHLPHCKSPLGYDPSATSVSESKCMSEYELDESLQHWTRDFSLKPKPKPKADVFLHYRDKDTHDYFNVYSVEEDGTISPKYDMYPPSPINKDWFFSSTSRNGLLHFKHRRSDDDLLWNPTTNEFKFLPKSFDKLPPRVSRDYLFSIMWSDHRCEDYKVLQLVDVGLDDEEGELIDASQHIELYSLKSNSWKKIECKEFSDICISGHCTNGDFFYCRAGLEGEEHRVILSFDFSTETLSTLPLPNIPEQHSLRVLEYKGLCSILLYRIPLVTAHSKYEHWVMNNGSWTRQSVFHTCGVLKPLWFSENGELLYFASVNDELLVFDRATGKLKHLGIYFSPRFICLYPFSESFVQLNGISDDEVNTHQ